MSKAQELPIYKAAYDLLVTITKQTENFPKNFKYGIAKDISHSAQNVVTLIFKANCTHDDATKILFLEQIRDEVQLIGLLLTLFTDLHLISPRQFGNLSLSLTEIGKQNQGWLSYFRKKNAS